MTKLKERLMKHEPLVFMDFYGVSCVPVNEFDKAPTELWQSRAGARFTQVWVATLNFDVQNRTDD